MKAFKTGFSFVLTSLLVLTVVLGTVAFYPAPKKYDYPQYPSAGVTDYNSPEYKQQQEKYQQDMKDYQEKNKTSLDQAKIWSQNVLIVILISSVAMFLIGGLVFKISYFLSISMFFAGFILLFSGSGLVSYYGDSTTLSFLGTQSQTDLSLYKQIQFGIVLIGSLVGSGLSLIIFKENKQL